MNALHLQSSVVYLQLLNPIETPVKLARVRPYIVPIETLRTKTKNVTSLGIQQRCLRSNGSESYYRHQEHQRESVEEGGEKGLGAELDTMKYLSFFLVPTSKKPLDP